MLFVTCESLSDGLIPSEAVVSIRTADGDEEEVVVDRAVVADNKLQVAQIGVSNGRVLVELPRESASGRWRLWVPSENLRRAGASR